MEDKPVIRTAARPGILLDRSRRIALLAAISLAMGCGMLASPASSQSITDRFKGLFGGKSEEAPAPGAPPAAAEAPSDLSCPPVSIRAGASTYQVAAPGKQPVGNDLRFQVTITRTARECSYNAGEITARIGIQGRVIAGPAGAPSSCRHPDPGGGGAVRRAGKDHRHQGLPDLGVDDRGRQRAVHAGRRRSGVSGAVRSGRRFLHLLYRLRSAGAEAGAEGEGQKK